MSVTYTSLLGLALPATATEAGTWGDVVNNYLTNYVDSAVAGALTVTTDTTLTKTTGSSLGATSSQYAIIIASPTSAAITITAPAASKTYVVNNTSGTYTVTFKAVGQTGVTLAVFEKCVIAFNGTDFVKVASTVVSATGLTGTVPVANGGTGSSTLTLNNVLLGNGTSALQAVAPGTSGNILTSNGTTWTSAAPASGSKVIQVVSATTTTEVNVTSAYADSGVTATITPTSASNKVLVWISSNIGSGSPSAGNYPNGTYQILRDATIIYGPTGNMISFWNPSPSISGSGTERLSVGTLSVNFLDTPATTSATTYKLQGRSNANLRFQNNTSNGSIILMEVTP
jgi:hypothetical protein